MCTLLKLDYAKFGVVTYYFQKLYKKNLWGGGGLALFTIGKGKANFMLL